MKEIQDNSANQDLEQVKGSGNVLCIILFVPRSILLFFSFYCLSQVSDLCGLHQ